MEDSEPYVAAGLIEAAMQLESQGAEIVPIRFELLHHAGAIHQIVQHAEAARAHSPWFETQQPHYGDQVRTRLEAGRLLPASTYLAAQQARRPVTLTETTQASRSPPAGFATRRATGTSTRSRARLPRRSSRSRRA